MQTVVQYWLLVGNGGRFFKYPEFNELEEVKGTAA